MIRSSSLVTGSQKPASRFRKKRLSSHGKEQKDKVYETENSSSEECVETQNQNTADSGEINSGHKTAETKVESSKESLFGGEHKATESFTALEKWESDLTNDMDAEDEMQDHIASNNTEEREKVNQKLKVWTLIILTLTQTKNHRHKSLMNKN